MATATACSAGPETLVAPLAEPPRTSDNSLGTVHRDFCLSGLNGLTAGGTSGLDNVSAPVLLQHLYLPAHSALNGFSHVLRTALCSMRPHVARGLPSQDEYSCRDMTDVPAWRLLQGVFQVTASQPVGYCVEETTNIFDLNNTVSLLSTATQPP